MLLITVGLVLVGIIFLAIGVITQTTALLLISIACAVIAGVTLLVQSRLSRREAAPAGTGVASAPAPSPPPDREPVTARHEAVGAEREGVAAASWPAPPTPSPAPSTRQEEVVPAAPLAVEEDEQFPIADYDELRVSEILPLLTELDLDELEVVREREEQGKNRSVVIDRIDDLIDELEAEEVEVEEVEVVASPDTFPIEDYDALSAEQILPLLPELDDEELDMVYDREEQGQNRAVILDAIDDMFEEEPALVEAAVPTPAAPAVETVKKAPAKKAPAKKAPAKKVTVEKVTVEKVPAKKVPAKKVPAKKVAAKKVAAKKVGRPKKVAPVKKATVKKGTVKKGTVKKGTVKKVTVKKATVKKAAKAAKKR